MQGANAQGANARDANAVGTVECPLRETEAGQRPGGLRKMAWLALGWTFFAIGAVGVVLPGLPTTGPMLLALACFARGSDRLHDWLMNHRLFGPPLREWQEHRVMPLRAKIIAITMMSGSMTYIVFFASMPLWLVVTIASVIVVGMVVVLRIPHRRRA